MEKSLISISDIRFKQSGQRNPLIVEFQNGDVTPDNMNDFRVRLVAYDELDKKTVKVLSKNKQKFVNSMICSSPSVRFVAIRNKKSNEVKLIQADYASLINQAHTKEIKIFKQDKTVEEQIKQLKRAFGTKKAKRLLKESELYQINNSLVEGQISEVLNDNSINESSLIIDNECDNTVNFTPPCNREAKTVKEVYKMDDFLSHEELLTLENIADKILQNQIDTSKYTEFFKEYLEQILNTNENHQKKICCLIYASALVTYLKEPAKGLRKIASCLCPYSVMISNKIIRDFCIQSGTLIHRPLAMKDKAICYVTVLLTMAKDFKIDLEKLAKQSACGFKKMKQLGTLVGLVPESRNSRIYELKLPLPPPPKMVRSFQKKN